MFPKVSYSDVEICQRFPDAFDEFANLNIGAICDLRSHEEAETSPSPSGYPFDSRVHLPIWPGSSVQFQTKFMESGEEPKEEDFREFMINVTREIALDHMDVYSKFLDLLLNTSEDSYFTAQLARIEQEVEVRSFCMH